MSDPFDDDVQQHIQRLIDPLWSLIAQRFYAQGALNIADTLNIRSVLSAVDDHFRETTLNTAWNWAGAPFVTPTIAFVDSVARITALTGAQRSFLYRTAFNANGWVVACALTSLSVGYASGFRLDDGSDNNYAEAVLRTSQASPTQWQFQVRWRTGAGAVNTANGNIVTTPSTFALYPQRTGTAWSSWGVAFVTQQIPSIGGVHWNPNSAVTGLTWTPTRAGIIVDGGGTAAAFNTAYIDYAKIS